MTSKSYMALRRRLALMDSHALRGFARQGRLPRTRHNDTWAEWWAHTGGDAARAGKRREAA